MMSSFLIQVKHAAYPRGFDKAHAENQFIEFRQELAPIAQENRITICIEPLNARRQSQWFMATPKTVKPISQIFLRALNNAGPAWSTPGGMEAAHCPLENSFESLVTQVAPMIQLLHARFEDA